MNRSVMLFKQLLSVDTDFVVTEKERVGRISHERYQYHLHSQHPKIGQPQSMYYRCIEVNVAKESK